MSITHILLSWYSPWLESLCPTSTSKVDLTKIKANQHTIAKYWSWKSRRSWWGVEANVEALAKIKELMSKVVESTLLLFILMFVVLNGVASASVSMAKAMGACNTWGYGSVYHGKLWVPITWKVMGATWEVKGGSFLTFSWFSG